MARLLAECLTRNCESCVAGGSLEGVCRPESHAGESSSGGCHFVCSQNEEFGNF